MCPPIPWAIWTTARAGPRPSQRAQAMHSPSELVSRKRSITTGVEGVAITNVRSCLRPNSASVKLRRALFEKGGGAFLLVFRCRADAEIGRFERKPLGLAGVHPLVG